MSPSTTEPRLLTEREAASYLNVSSAFLRKSRSDGPRAGHAPAPPHIKVGRMVRYALTDLDHWIEIHRVGE